MDAVGLAVILVAIFAWGAFSGRVTAISAPILFVAIGFSLATGLGVGSGVQSSHSIRLIAEATLVWVLFADASRVRPAQLRGNLGLEVRLLFIGLPLTTIVGTILAVAVLGASPWYALLVGAALAPTDAALGSAVMSDRRIDHRVRQTLNVESGLNDGIATPIVTFALASIAAQAGITPAGDAIGALLGLTIGAGTGLLLGASGGAVLRFTRRRGWGSDEAIGPGLLALAMLAYIVAVLLGANGFVAAFLAGSAFGAVAGRGGEAEVYYVEQTCGLASMISWFVFGAVAVPVITNHMTWRIGLYAVLSLTVVRMVPVALALLGTKVDRTTVLFIGWFGPRGLASVVFALLALEDLQEVSGPVDDVVATIGLTVLLSVVAHGLTAHPLAGRYAAVHPAAKDISENREPTLRGLSRQLRRKQQ